jgi:hypothetical protein
MTHLLIVFKNLSVILRKIRINNGREVEGYKAELIHLLKVVTLMQASENWDEFIKKFNRVFGVIEQMELDDSKKSIILSK